jgi:hypothetical protein
MTVERLWPASTVVCIGTGPSLTREDVDACRGRARVIAIKHAIEWAPWADALYGSGGDGGKWWQRNGPGLADYQGLRYTLDPKAAPWATVLKNAGFTGLESSPSGLRTGKNSGFAAINLAVHLGASRIVLLGYDMRPDATDRDHFFGQHWHHGRVPLRMFVELFDSLVEPLRALGIQILNATRSTALTAFPCVSLEEALA